MPKRLVRSFALLLALLLANTCTLWAQFGLGKHKDKETEKLTTSSDKAPELTEAEKKKLAEIEQRPEIKDEIQTEWDEQRRHDLEFAYSVNSSTQLYDNPMLQRHINKIGQKLVPKDSPNLYSFKLLLDPVPRAESLSTGTIYVSTGLVAMLDNEAQLAYILGHEIAHIERQHLYNEYKNAVLQRELNVEKEKSAERRRTIISLVSGGIGAGLGAKFGGGDGAAMGALLGLGGGILGSHFLVRSKTTTTEWSTVYENEADEAGFKYMLEQNYDVREVPRLYARLDNMVTRDSRVGLGFIGKLSRVKERSTNIQGLIGGSYKEKIDAKLKAGGLIGSDREFPVLMAALKRDNGILAIDYDLFAVARDNLEDAVSLRSNDARAQLYLGKIIALTGRSQEDQQQAQAHFSKALQVDEPRRLQEDSHLERALFLLSQSNPANQDEIQKELQTYMVLYQRNNLQLPRNSQTIYDYFTLAGDSQWYLPPIGAPALNIKQVTEKKVEQPSPRPTVSGGTVQPAARHKKNAADGPR